ncbi:MAG: hypothetical protein ABSG01_16380, partial [Anaerolineales bacterium]
VHPFRPGQPAGDRRSPETGYVGNSVPAGRGGIAAGCVYSFAAASQKALALHVPLEAQANPRPAGNPGDRLRAIPGIPSKPTDGRGADRTRGYRHQPTNGAATDGRVYDLGGCLPHANGSSNRPQRAGTGSADLREAADPTHQPAVHRSGQRGGGGGLAHDGSSRPAGE